ncbi:hypothetical protein PMZ80_008871 [Knufia obscura]|uniref:Phosphoglycerate mutase family protein n=1 Tax=Knufia obscura TaxID=1635080 RepID=A0ABR0RDI9_9EURO|nr:hypothetical protein PMZ80_008871 [Knufia obscura]
MPKQPSAIIIVRHGTRLDQADKRWRDTAEHPYDPPLSYGGWIQCQTLGARIDRELASLEQLAAPIDSETEENSGRPRKKRKVIIHTSPYKRCVQTSIAIAAGLRYPQPEQVRPLPTPFQRSSLSRTSTISATSRGDALTQPRNQPPTEEGEKLAKNSKIELKLDPYLGEWLSPSYFEDSKPPPSTDLIVERARETLTRPLEEIRGADLSAFLPVPESPEYDKENELAANASVEKGGLRAMAAAGHSLPHRTRATSFGVDRINGAQKLRQRSRTTNVYSPPVPQYSLAPQDPIPAGYVAHARDGCAEPDLTWDSAELGWGDAGAFPEEWSTMHVRLRLGLQKMLAFYEDYKPTSSENGEKDVDEDIVLVLVTHQAGANALIRLMTGAPALHDVGVASLTLAVRRPVLRRPPSLANTSHSPLGYDRESRRNSRRGSLDLGLADEFEMRIIASTEHLRFGSNPLGLNSPRLGRSPAMSGRRMAGSDSLEGFSIGDPLGWRPSSFANLGRSTSQRGKIADTSSKPAMNTGLWGSPGISAVAKEPVDEGLEELPPMSPKSRPVTPVDTDSVSVSTLSSPTRSRSNTVQGAGLWGGSSANLAVRSGPGEGTWSSSSSGTLDTGSIGRARSPAKRRWTAISNSP